MYKIIFINNGEAHSSFAIVQEYIFEKQPAFRIIKYFENLTEVRDFLFEMDILYKGIIKEV